MKDSNVRSQGRARSAGRLASLLFLGLTGVAAATVPTACQRSVPDENVTGAQSSSAASTGAGTGTGTITDETFTKAALLEAAAECAIGRYGEFESLALALRDSAGAFAADRTEANAAAARGAWIAAMASWQEAEVFRFGPAARSGEPGGLDLRDQIYGWPLVSRCKIEEQIVSQVYAGPDFPQTLINSRGLAAYEYLLFYEGTDNACSEFSVINAQGTWAALAPEELAQRKADYAAAVAADIHARAGALVQAWDPASGNFRKQLVEAGKGSEVFATDQEALNAVSDALFYVEKELKDWKLGKPLGLIECLTPTCPEAVESPYARVSTAHMKANLAGFRRLFQGCGSYGTGLGFDDWLRAVGAGELADAMLDALAKAQASVDSLDPPMEEAIVSDVPKVQAVHAAVKGLTDQLKTDMVTVLNLELPKTSEGDND